MDDNIKLFYSCSNFYNKCMSIYNTVKYLYYKEKLIPLIIFGLTLGVFLTTTKEDKLFYLLRY